MYPFLWQNNKVLWNSIASAIGKSMINNGIPKGTVSYFQEKQQHNIAFSHKKNGKL